MWNSEGSVGVEMDSLEDSAIGKVFALLFKIIMRPLGYALFIFAIFIQCFLTYFVQFVMIPEITQNASFFNPIRMFFHLLGVYVSLNVHMQFILTVFRSPGSPSEEFFRSVQDQLEHLREQTETVKGKYFSKWCKVCDKPKPPRCHHCHVCGKCVVRMDHHCPWMNNCIGHRNHRNFYLFTWWAFIGTFFVSIFAFGMSSGILPSGEIWASWSGWMKMINLMCFPLCLAILFFLVLHTYLILTNQTSVEFQDNKLRQVQYRLIGGRKPVNKYDIGYSRNFISILGVKQFWRLLLPIWKETPGDGCSFKTGSDVGDQV